MGAKWIYISHGNRGYKWGKGNQQEDGEIGMKSKGTEQTSEYTVLKCCIHANKKQNPI